MPEHCSTQGLTEVCVHQQVESCNCSWRQSCVDRRIGMCVLDQLAAAATLTGAPLPGAVKVLRAAASMAAAQSKRMCTNPARI